MVRKRLTKEEMVEIILSNNPPKNHYGLENKSGYFLTCKSRKEIADIFFSLNLHLTTHLTKYERDRAEFEHEQRSESVPKDKHNGGMVSVEE